MRTLIAAMAAAAICPVLAAPATALPTNYLFEQTSATVPGLVVTGEIRINGGFADLPSLSSWQTCHKSTPVCGPVDFGNLLGISVESNLTAAWFTLHDLRPSPVSDYPAWDIVPDGGLNPGIRWIDASDLDDIFINGWENSVIKTDTDDASSPCGRSGACVVTGHWIAAAVPIAEPAALSVLAAGLLLLAGARRRRLDWIV